MPTIYVLESSMSVGWVGMCRRKGSQMARQGERRGVDFVAFSVARSHYPAAMGRFKVARRCTCLLPARRVR